MKVDGLKTASDIDGRWSGGDGGEGEGDERVLTFMYALDGQMHGVNIGWNVYQDCAAILERNPQIRPAEGFAKIDAEWLSSVMA